MTNIQTITLTGLDGLPVDYVQIDLGNGQYQSMAKADYDALQAQSTLPSNSSTPQAGA